MANTAGAWEGAKGVRYVRYHGPPPPPPGWPPVPSQSPAMKPTLRPRLNAFDPKEPAVGVVDQFWEKFFLSDHDQELWQAALLGDIAGVKQIIERTDASVFIPPLEMEVVDDAGNSMELPPTRFRRWSLRMYVILQRMLLGQKEPLDEDLDERYERILQFLEDQENLIVVQLSTEMSEETEDGKIFSDLCNGSDIIGHRCSRSAVAQVELWQAALGQGCHDYFDGKLLSLLQEGVDPLMSCYETQVSHPYACRQWPLRMFCRVGRCKAAKEKLAILATHESCTVANAAQAIIDRQLSLTEKTWLKAIGIAF